MARPLRVHIPGALYHVMSRGNARQAIFVGPEDYEYFLERLSVTTSRFGVRCRAYCLMYNHFHLLLEPNQLPISRMMQQLNSSYSQRFNCRHERVGHVLQGRFKALLIDRDDYFRRVLRYIVLNPVRASVVQHPADWPWSSYRATAGLVERPSFLALDDVWKAFEARDERRAQEIDADFVGAGAADDGDAPSGPSYTAAPHLSHASVSRLHATTTCTISFTPSDSPSGRRSTSCSQTPPTRIPATRRCSRL